MPFVRYTRDKRGYESTMVMHVYRSGASAQRTRVLYLFRSPPNVRVGRRPLDPEVVEALEHTHPDLTFDWTNLLREPPPPRPEPRERPSRPNRPPRTGAAVAPASAPPVQVDDQSLLGRVLGAEQAVRLRSKYQELLQRIARRATTPEQREQLTDRAGRLNPDEWTDESAVRTASRTVEQEWAAIAEELPQRRRGRRGGRHRAAGRLEPSAAGQSEIMASNGESRVDQREARVADSDRVDAGDRDSDPLSPDDVEPAETRTATDVPGDD